MELRHRAHRAKQLIRSVNSVSELGALCDKNRREQFDSFSFGSCTPFSTIFMKTLLLLVASNIFMTLAWYGQLK
jgi:hypothetical protein